MADAASELDEVRAFYARQMALASRSDDPRIERICELVPREAFLGPGPWHIMASDRYIETPRADPRYLYQNNLVGLKADKRINNGEPFLHAAWIGAIAPKAGETVSHVGAGTGYYSAILSMLVLPGGELHAYEIEDDLAMAARRNLVPFDNVTVVSGNAVELPLPSSDIVYVNAGVVAPPLQWLKALRPGGRLMFPWRPGKTTGIACLVTNTSAGFALKPLMPSWFIPCVGASETDPDAPPVDAGAAWRSRSIVITADRKPDNTATAIYRDVWFSSAAV